MSKTIVLGVTSGIAAFKTIELVKRLRDSGFSIFVVMTESASCMVSPKEFEKASGHRVFTELFEKDFDYKKILKLQKVDHIALADRADMVVIAPATANIIAKMACGIADDFLTTMVLATRAPLLVCPSMNVHMWSNPAVERNITELKKRGFVILDPEEGPLACGYQGKGRLPHIKKIEETILSLFRREKRLLGKKILVTAGASIEKIDDVRFISNRGSGKMGAALSYECYLQGAHVLLLRSETSVDMHLPVSQKLFETSGDLAKLIGRYTPSFDMIFHTAAVSDFQIRNTRKGKISTKQSTTLMLSPSLKIINSIKKVNPKIKLIGFKAEFGLKNNDVFSEAIKKIKESNADAIVLNDVSLKDRGFHADMNEVYIVTKKGASIKLPLAPKSEIAREILDFLFGQGIN